MISAGRTARRLAAVEHLVVPAAARQRVQMRRPGLARAGLEVGEAGLRQWFRLVARQPKTVMVVPSRLVDDLWAELARDHRSYGEFCGAAFGRLLLHEPLTAETAGKLASSRPEGLLATLRCARAEEGAAGVPLVFRTDREAGLAQYGYVADCGARADCHVPRDAACLHHLGGIERRSFGGGMSVERRFEVGGEVGGAGGGP